MRKRNYRKNYRILISKSIKTMKKENLQAILDTKDAITYNDLKGLNPEVIELISKKNNDPVWMKELRFKAFEIYKKKDIPLWGPNISHLDLDALYYFAEASSEENKRTWDDVPEDIKATFEKLGIPEAEKAMLAWVWAQYDSRWVYHNIKEIYQKQGVIFDDLSEAVKKYGALIEKYFSHAIPLADHKFSALHYAVWSWGTFLYIPAGVKIEEPLQSYFRMNRSAGGQFEHTLIILEEWAEAHYIEGCSAPKYWTSSLHAWGVEIFVGKNARLRYSSVENWSLDTYNLNTKRAIVEENGAIEWLGGNMGSQVTMLYPCSVLKWENSSAEHLGIALAGAWQNQDTGAKIIHIGKNTRSKVVSKSLSKEGGKNTYRALLDIKPSAENAVASMDCDGLLLDDRSTSDTYPDIRVANGTAIVAQEASAGKINEEHLFYLQSRGMSESEAKTMIVNGFISPVLKELPLEYASELNVLISLELEKSIW